MHEVASDEASEGEGAGDPGLGRPGEAQHQEGDEGDRDLDAHRVLARAEEAGDGEGLFDPGEEQFYGSAPLVEVGDLAGGCGEVVGDEVQHAAAVDAQRDLVHGLGGGVRAVPGLAPGQEADLVGTGYRLSEDDAMDSASQPTNATGLAARWSC